MFGFDGATAGLEKILNGYVSNHEQYTHKEIRAYARCLLNLLPALDLDLKLNSEVETLLAALSTSGLPHYDRVFLAKRILMLIAASKEAKTKIKFDVSCENF
jgi:hypothetical protein